MKVLNKNPQLVESSSHKLFPVNLCTSQDQRLKISESFMVDRVYFIYLNQFIKKVKCKSLRFPIGFEKAIYQVIIFKWKSMLMHWKAIKKCTDFQFESLPVTLQYLPSLRRPHVPACLSLIMSSAKWQCQRIFKNIFYKDKIILILIHC